MYGDSAVRDVIMDIMSTIRPAQLTWSTQSMITQTYVRAGDQGVGRQASQCGHGRGGPTPTPRDAKGGLST